MKNPPTLTDVVPTVEEAEGLLHVHEFQPGRTEIYHHGQWIVSEIQRAAPHPDTGEARVYLRLGDERETRRIPKIDLDSGLVDDLVFDVHVGPTLLTPVTTLRRARHRTIFEEA